MGRRRNKHYEDILDQGKELIKFYNENPCIAVYDLLGVDLSPIQRVVFEDMWFKNYIIVVASRGYGKSFGLGVLSALSCMLRPGYRVGLIAPAFRQCLIISDTYDTFWTSSGLKTTSLGFYNSIAPGITQTQSLYNQNTILSKWENDERACKYIKTKKGFELSGSVDHKIIKLNNNFDLEYVELQDIKEPDYVLIKRGFNYFGNNDSLPNMDDFKTDWRTKDCNIPTTITNDLSYWMGLLTGDGCVSVSADKRKYRVIFTNEDKDLLDSFESYLRKFFIINNDDIIDRRHKSNNTYEITYYSKKLVNFLLKCGFTKTNALEKKVPCVIKRASKDIVISFLNGLFDSDGCVYIQNHNHGYTHCEVSLSTSSLQLAKEVQSILLNLGIVSNLGISVNGSNRKLLGRKKDSKCAIGYKIRITGKEFLTLFHDIINFRCERKKEDLGNYLDNHLLKEGSLGRLVGLPNRIVKDNISKFEDYANNGFYFVSIVDYDYFFAHTMDVEVESESCYWSSGFISHNSKMIFSEVEKLYSQSPILREACERQPVRGSDSCYLRFKSVGGMTPSYIEALPLGTDGSKIRGSRFYLIVVDEVAQVPDQILDLVIRPFAATTLAPMERVRRLEQKKRLIELGLATEEDFEEETVNKMIMTSSGYYKFNHLWRRMKDHWSQMEIAESRGEVCKYSVWQIPHWDLPEGFLDTNNIDEARRVMSSAEFRMEYEAAMISDSEGFFKASLLELCTAGSSHTIESRGEKGHNYVLGVDPNQGGKASTGITIVKLGTINRLVQVLELKRHTTQQLTNAVQEICEAFNIVRVFMDKGGGGKAICDLLEDGYGGYEPIIDRTNEDHKHLQGRHILEMINFNPAWISDANFTAKAMLEDKKLLFPEAPIKSTLDVDAVSYEAVTKLKSQMLSIIVTQTSSGILHFDTPSKNQNKDLYSAFILSAHGARMIEKELEVDNEPILHNVGGMLRLRNAPSNSFRSFENQKVNQGNSPIASAVLKKKVK